LHQDWSLATIESGCENISFGSLSFSLSKNAFILIPPYSIHKHWGNSKNVWSYKAIYLNNDVVKNVARKLNIDYSYLASFPYFVSYIGNRFESNETSILNILENIFIENVKDKVSINLGNQEAYNDILDYFSRHYNESITLDKLEVLFKINKFNLQRDFKKRIGLSPAEYLNVIRIENAKQLFHTSATLADIALNSGFHDQSHFTHSFAKYVGITPGVYKKNIKILQD